MGDTSKEMLNEALVDMFESLKHQKGEERLKTIEEGIVPLYKLKNEELKIDNEAVDRYNKLEVETKQFNAEVDNKNQQFEAELEIKNRQIETDIYMRDQQRKDRFIEIALQGGLTVGGLLFQWFLCKKIMAFEEGGHIFTSIVAKNFVPKVVPKIK